MTETLSGDLFLWASRLALVATAIGVWTWVIRKKITPAAHRSSPRLSESLRGFPTTWVCLASAVTVLASWPLLP